MKTICNSIDPQKEAEREAVAKQVAEWEARNGPIQTQPLKALSHDGRRIENGQVQLTIVNKRKWNL